ncbi:H-type lectin domain-containing protein [Sedimentitalea sp. XS_ASV28]|uniref:H-type lectin domain-containing protein n=1 Tax=Sedimentitalea sp. XS_ASV28 TaxID=3241296 RepID=UPI0035183B06
MKRLESHLLGIDQGDVVLFSDFENDGEMWTGSGPRECRKHIEFDQRYREPPVVQVSISLWDAKASTALRAELVTRDVTTQGFDIVFRTWADTRFARIRAAWIAIGALPHSDDWELY